jgi:hypothetical protein
VCREAGYAGLKDQNGELNRFSLTQTQKMRRNVQKWWESILIELIPTDVQGTTSLRNTALILVILNPATSEKKPLNLDISRSLAGSH